MATHSYHVSKVHLVCCPEFGCDNLSIVNDKNLLVLCYFLLNYFVVISHLLISSVFVVHDCFSSNLHSALYGVQHCFLWNSQHWLFILRSSLTFPGDSLDGTFFCLLVSTIFIPCLCICVCVFDFLDSSVILSLLSDFSAFSFLIYVAVNVCLPWPKLSFLWDKKVKGLSNVASAANLELLMGCSSWESMKNCYFYLGLANKVVDDFRLFRKATLIVNKLIPRASTWKRASKSLNCFWKRVFI